MSKSANLHQCTCPFYSSHASFFAKTSHHPGLSLPLQSRFGSLLLLVFPKAKIAFESEEICECGGHTVHKLSQRRLTANGLASRVSDCSRMCNKVSSDWLPSYIKAMRLVLNIFKMTGYFPYRARNSYFCLFGILWCGMLHPFQNQFLCLKSVQYSSCSKLMRINRDLSLFTQQFGR